MFATLGARFLSGSGDVLWNGSFSPGIITPSDVVQGFGWQVAGISNMANTAFHAVEGAGTFAAGANTGIPANWSDGGTAMLRAFSNLITGTQVKEGVKSFRTLFAAMVGYGRQNRKQLDFADPNSGISIIDDDALGAVNYVYGRSLRYHPAGLKYGYMNCDHLSPSAVHRGDRYGQFRDMLEQRLYGKTYSFGDEFNKRGEAESAVSCIFVDADGSPIDDYTKTQCLNLSTAMTSSKPFIEGEVMREIIFSSESVTIE